MSHATIVGTGSWGTTLAILVARKHLEATLLTRAEPEATTLQAERQNSRFVPGFPFPNTLTVSASTSESLANARVVILVVPAQRLRENCRWLVPHLAPDSIVVSATKGLELDTGKCMSEVLREELPERFHNSICVLSGPNLAMEILQDKPSSSVVE